MKSVFKTLAAAACLAFAFALTAPAAQAQTPATEAPAENEQSQPAYKIVDVKTNDAETTIVVEAYNLGDNLLVTAAKLNTAEKPYNCKMMMCANSADKGTITLTFPYADQLKGDETLTITVNGQEATVNFDAPQPDPEAAPQQ